MNLWLRLIWLLIATPFRPRLTLPDDRSTLYFRVWPHDLDTSVHMNNGRYLTLMDLGRFDIIARSGLLSALLKHRWTPIASAISVTYRRELRPFQKFRLETGLIYWEQTFVVMEQTFYIVGGPRDGQLSARALFKGGLYDRATSTFISTDVLMKEIGIFTESPPATPEVQAFLKAHAKPQRTPEPAGDDNSMNPQ